MNYELLNKKAITSWRIGRAITIVILIGAYIGMYFILDSANAPDIVRYILMGGGAALLLYKAVGLFIFPLIEYKQWKYCVTDDRVEIVHGIFFITRTVIPVIRIQNISVSQGPINRKMGLYKVKIYLASGSFEIEGLTKEVADSISENLKSRIYSRIAEKGVL